LQVPSASALYQNMSHSSTVPRVNVPKLLTNGCSLMDVELLNLELDLCQIARCDNPPDSSNRVDHQGEQPFCTFFSSRITFISSVEYIKFRILAVSISCHSTQFPKAL
jgi:hypothetical protein